jgi:hypothetical protein
MGNKRLKKKSLRKNRNKTVKKGAGMFDGFRNYSSRMYNTTRNGAINLASSGKEIMNSKYLFTLLANPANVHRMLFKNSHFIEFINFSQIQRLYCNGQQPNCVVLKDGYLYSNNPMVVASSNNEMQNKQMDLQAINDNGNATSPQEAVQAKQLLVNVEEASDKLDEQMDNQISNYGFVGQTMNRLAFAKLNDALLTDNTQLANVDPYYITFKPGFQPLFELFTIYKYQVNRTLWYGGWTEWAYITKSMNQLIKNNPLLTQFFLSQLWGTAGFIKLIKFIFSKAPSYLLNSFRGLTPQKAQLEANQKDNEETQKALQKNQQEEIKDNMQQPVQAAGQGFFSRNYTRLNNTMSRGYQGIRSRVSPMGNSITKYRIIRVLLKYYDIDPDKYNFNLLKRAGLLKKNYPVFMDMEARKAVYTAIYNYKMKGNTRISQVTPLNPNDQSYMQQSLDQLLNQLLQFNTYGGGQGTRKNGRSNKRIKMTGGGLFFENIKFIFSESYKFMINNQMNKLTMFMNQSPQMNTELVAEMYAELVRCVAMMTMTLCMTLGNMILGKVVTGPVSVSTPHCYISNGMYIYLIFKILELDYSKVNIINSMTNNTNAIPTTAQTLPTPIVPVGQMNGVPVGQMNGVPVGQMNGVPVGQMNGVPGQQLPLAQPMM